MSDRALNRRTALTGALAFALTVRGDRDARATSKPMVAVSLPLLADIVRNIAGDDFEVYAVMPENGDPHTWEANPRDLARVSSAALFVSMGASLEAFIESGGWRRAVKDAGVPELILAEHLDLIAVDKVIDHGDHIHDLREGDPHVWLDPRKVVAMAPVIASALTALAPNAADGIALNAASYQTKLNELDEELVRDLGAIPVERRKLVVFHDAYTYFAQRFGFEIVGIVLANHNAEPSAGELAGLIETIQAHCVPVVFAEPHFNTDVLDVVVEEIGIEIGELLTDSFAGLVDSYVDLMRFNRDSLVRHLFDEWDDRC